MPNTFRFAMVLLFLLLTKHSFAGDISKKFCGVREPSQAHDLENIPKVLYSIVSGEAGKKRNWPLMRELFAPEAKITPVFHVDKGFEIKSFSLDEFVKLNEVVFSDVNFFETEVNSKVYKYGNTATIISQYESRDSIEAKPYSTGVNSFQLVNDGRRWCVVSVTWDSDKGPLSSNHFIVQ